MVSPLFLCTVGGISAGAFATEVFVETIGQCDDAVVLCAYAISALEWKVEIGQ